MLGGLHVRVSFSRFDIRELTVGLRRGDVGWMYIPLEPDRLPSFKLRTIIVQNVVLLSVTMLIHFEY